MLNPFARLPGGRGVELDVCRWRRFGEFPSELVPREEGAGGCGGGCRFPVAVSFGGPSARGLSTGRVRPWGLVLRMAKRRGLDELGRAAVGDLGGSVRGWRGIGEAVEPEGAGPACGSE